MTQNSLKQALDSIVHEHGFELVSQSLREIGLSQHQPESSKRNTRPPDRGVATAPRERKSRVTAPEHVAKMDLPAEKEKAVAELARRFEDKAFMPTFGDIANFCQIHGVDEPASRSRASAIPRVFKFIASMEADEIQRLLDLRMFSGPARLGPIADAIRSSGRARRSSAGSGVAS
jgi:hypothetical protein